MKYGKLPKELGIYEVDCKEMMFYQYLPIKFPNGCLFKEMRLTCFNELLNAISKDFITDFGVDKYINSYIYLTAKSLYVEPNKSFNREGWHSDGFLTEDINYIWSDKYPTIFNNSNFELSQDDLLSMDEMEIQALPVNNITFKEKELLRLDQFSIHKVAPITECKIRTFVKVSFSKDKYNLIGNSHNYLLDYEWEMKPRKQQRNITTQ